jgi:hypothetical protein
MSAHATLAIEASGLEVPGRCSCAATGLWRSRPTAKTSVA